MNARKKVIPLKKITNSISPTRPKSVAELKKKYKQLPLHFLFGIEKEIEHQCPILDEYLEKLTEVKYSLEKIRKSKDLKSVQIDAAVALHEMSNLSPGIDEITRINFEKLRATADAWKQLALAAINETKEPEKFLKI